MAENLVCIERTSVLLAEDNELNQQVFLAMLRHLGYGADTALDGVEVLLALKNKRYDLILMNIGLPLMDGIETTIEIRRRYRNGPKIVAVTAYTFPGMKEKCQEAGMNGYILKPVRVNELDRVLRKYLRFN